MGNKEFPEIIEALKKVCNMIKVTIKTPEQLFAVFIVDFGYNSHPFLVFLLLTLNK